MISYWKDIGKMLFDDNKMKMARKPEKIQREMAVG